MLSSVRLGLFGWERLGNVGLSLGLVSLCLYELILATCYPGWTHK
jgi:hypothetical protein